MQRKIRPVDGTAEAHRQPSVIVTATFTAEPIELALRFWLKELGMDGGIRFAPYNQVFQQLLDPHSLLGRNRDGVNIVLIRFEDLLQFRPDESREETLRGNVEVFASALHSFSGGCTAPTLVWAAPTSADLARDPALSALVVDMRARLAEVVERCDSLHWLGLEAVAPYMVERIDDHHANRIGHIPYSPHFYAALATAAARRIHLIRSEPYKVLAMDCDNTLWQGVVGEDGPQGVSLTPGKRALQEFAVHQQQKGMLLCLVSKNAESDVFAVFQERPEMPLRPEHLAAWRVGWRPKSQSPAELAAELNLGLDGFIFLDDNPLECAEVRAALPEVLTLQIPTDDAEIPEFLRHVWAFDRRKCTDEDRRRTLMYRQTAERSRFEREAAGVGEFLAALRLRVDIARPDGEEWTRVAQLTQRTNQFNLTTVRRTEAEVRKLDRSGLGCLRVRVSDRFGDYGLVGVLIFGARGDALRIDTMLLSCRVLGRGIEHAMLAHLGELAVRQGLARVEAPFVPSPRNEPTENFLMNTGGVRGEEAENRSVFQFFAEVAAGIKYLPVTPSAPYLMSARAGETGGNRGTAPAPGRRRRDKSTLYCRIGADLRRAEAVQRAAEADAVTSRPTLAPPLIEPRTPLQSKLTALWARVLLVDRVGIDDEFELLGGTSLTAARLFAEIERSFGIHLPMTTILEAPTVEQLALRIERGAQSSLKQFKTGAENGPALFFVHDGDGETLLYANLARRVPESVSVYGLEPRGTRECPLLHTSVRAMAAYYVEQIRQAQPHGPIFLAGMCAGGVIAFEMALQLQAEGRPADSVVLLDSAAPQAERHAGLTAGRRRTRFLHALREPRGGALPGRLARLTARLAAKVRNLAVYETAAWTRRLWDEARFHLFRLVADKGRRVPWGLRGLTVRTVYKLAERQYAPSARLEAPVILFRATEGTGDDEPFQHLFRDPLLGWGRYVTDRPEVVETPGGHSSMLQEPHVRELAACLSKHMEQALTAEVVC